MPITLESEQDFSQRLKERLGADDDFLALPTNLKEEAVQKLYDRHWEALAPSDPERVPLQDVSPETMASALFQAQGKMDIAQATVYGRRVKGGPYAKKRMFRNRGADDDWQEGLALYQNQELPRAARGLGVSEQEYLELKDKADAWGISPQDYKFYASKGKIEYDEALSRTDIEEKLPFWGMSRRSKRIWEIRNHVATLQRDMAENPGLDLSETQSAMVVRDYLDQRAELGIRGSTFGGKVMSGVTELPAFMAEFLLTGGFAAVGRTAGRRAALKMVGRHGAGKLTTKLAGGIAGAVTRTMHPVMLARVSAGMNERLLPEQMQLDPDGQLLIREAGESPTRAFVAAFGDVLIENLSETAGGEIGKLTGKLFGKLPGAGAAMRAAAGRLTPEAKRVLSAAEKAGWHGFFEEWSEERLGGLLRGAFAIDRSTEDLPLFERMLRSTFPDNWEDALAEAAVLATPATAVGLTQFGIKHAEPTAPPVTAAAPSPAAVPTAQQPPVQAAPITQTEPAREPEPLAPPAPIDQAGIISNAQAIIDSDPLSDEFEYGVRVITPEDAALLEVGDVLPASVHSDDFGVENIIENLRGTAVFTGGTIQEAFDFAADFNIGPSKLLLIRARENLGPGPQPEEGAAQFVDPEILAIYENYTAPPAPPPRTAAPPTTQAAPPEPLSAKSLKTAFNLTDEQAVATEALVDAMGLDKSKIQVAKGGEAGPEALKQEADVMGLYSALTTVAEGYKQAKTSGGDFYKWIQKQGGVKEEELEWSGLKDFLRGKTRVTKDEILGFLRENEVTVDETVRGGEVPTQAPAALEWQPVGAETLGYDAWQDDSGSWFIDNERGDEFSITYQGTELEESFDSLETAQAYVEQRHQELAVRRASATKFENYVLPGGENYRELLLTLPDPIAQEIESLSKQIDEITFRPAEEHAKHPEWQEQFDALVDKRLQLVEGRAEPFRGGHFPEPNVLAHVRFNERTDAEGNKVLFIEEVQSDWHQEGRKEGYQTKAKPQGLRVRSGSAERGYYEIEDENGVFVTNVTEATSPEVSSEAAALAEAQRRIDAGSRQIAWGSHAVPDAPFKKTWPELALKRMITWAAANNFDKVAWTTGEQQADRYDLSKQIAELAYWKEGEEYGLSAYTPDGEAVLDQAFYKATELEHVVGKDVAARIVADEGDTNSTTGFPDTAGVKYLRGENLKVGGQAMAAFYDMQMPRIASKLGKKYGAKVGKTKIATGKKQGKYTGRDFTLEEIRQIDTSRWTAAAERQLKSLELALAEGSEFREAIQFSGSEELVDALGQEGTLPWVDITSPVNSLDISPKLRDVATSEGLPRFQDTRGATEFTDDGKALVRGLQSPDFSTGVHEIAHVARKQLLDRTVPPENRAGITDEDIDIAERFAGAKDGKWTRAADEKFARGFERYLRDGKAASEKLRALFSKIAKWLREIYTKIKGSPLDIKMTPEMRGVMDKLVTRGERAAAKRPVTPPSTPAVAAPKPSEPTTGILPTPKVPEGVEGEPERAVAGQKAKESWEMTQDELSDVKPPDVRFWEGEDVTDYGWKEVWSEGKTDIKSGRIPTMYTESPAGVRFKFDSGTKLWIPDYVQHRAQVREAVSAGKSVPPEVLAQYGLKAPAAKPAEAEKAPEKPPSLNIVEARERSRPEAEAYKESAARLAKGRQAEAGERGVPKYLVADAVNAGFHHLKEGIAQGAETASKLRPWWNKQMAAEFKPSGIQLRAKDLDDVWKRVKARYKSEQVADQRKVREDKIKALKDAKLKKVTDELKHVDLMKKELTNYVNTVVPAKHRKRLTNRIANAKTRTQANHAADSVINTAQALASREDNILTPNELDDIIERHEAAGEREGFREGKLEVKATQEELINFIEEHLPLKLRGKLLRTLKNTVRPELLDKARAAVMKIHAAADHQIASQEYKATVKAAKGLMGSKRENPKIEDRFIQRIHDIIDDFRTKNITDATRERLEATIEAETFEEDLREDFQYQVAKDKAQKLLDEMTETTNIKDIDAADIRLLTQALNRVITEGKRVKEQKVGGHVRKIADQVKAILPMIAKRAKVRFVGEKGVAGGKAAKTSFARRYKDDSLDALRLFLNISGKREGPAWDHFIDILMGKSAQKKWFQRAYQEVFLPIEELLGHKITRRWISSTRNKTARFYRRKAVLTTVELPAIREAGMGAPAQTMKLDQAARIMLAWVVEDADALAKIMSKYSQGLFFPSDLQTGYKINNERLQVIKGALTEQDRAIMRIMRGFMNGPLYERVQESNIELKGNPLVQLVNHAPLFANTALEGGKHAGPFAQIRAPRIENTGRVTPRKGAKGYVIHDAFDAFYSQLTALSMLAEVALPVANADAFFHQTEVSTAISETLGPHYMQRIDAYLKAVAGTDQPKRTPGKEVFRYTKTKGVKAGLRWAVPVWIMQRFSQPFVAWNMGLKAASKGFAATARPLASKALSEEIEAISPWYWARYHLHGAVQIVSPTASSGDGVETLMRGGPSFDPGMNVLTSNDKSGVNGVYVAVKKAYAKELGRPELAKMDARHWPEDLQKELDRRFTPESVGSQPTFGVETLSGYQQAAREDAMFGSFMAFMAARTKIYNIAYEEALKWKMAETTGAVEYLAINAKHAARLFSFLTYAVGVNMFRKYLWAKIISGAIAGGIWAFATGGGDDEEDEKTTVARLKAAREAFGEGEDDTKWAAVAMDAISETAGLLPGANVVAGLVRLTAARMRGKHWQARVEDTNIVARNTQRLLDGVVKVQDAVAAEPGVFQSGPRKGQERSSAYWWEAADMLAEAVDALFLGVGYGGGKRIIKGVGKNIEAVEENK